ncbi:S8 family serine peptidase [Microcoleus sp. FACHB-68]|uniref:S8 family serine peptidase n=1 Tax=Microcoleus sp. FACHB-68 TaxID=2692826 RepID=UPI0018EF8E7F|nr:S8 family serine peptidase [Microcoleus sp. FACHB-68]
MAALNQRQIVKKLVWTVWSLGAAGLSVPVLALETSVGEAGIDATRLQNPPYNLLGRKIAIGQVEIGRPAQFGIDKKMSQNTGIAVTRVFQGNNRPKSDTNVDPHAQSVAGVMIGNAKALRGVAPAARLYSSSAISTRTKNRQFLECLATQHVAQQNSGDVRAINFSFGEPLTLDPRPDAVLDGNAPLTQCIDWSARVHDVLYVIAGNQGKGGIPIPTDNFNGVNVAFSNLDQGIFSKVDVANLGSTFTGFASRLAGLEGNVGDRRSISLVAPGRDISMLNPDGSISRTTGTSFAAPHVTATVALLQEFGDRQLRSRQPHWSLDARRQEVMKVVLLNSAEKVKDSGDGLLQNMTRTVTDKDNRDWLNSDAYKDPTIPLHAQIGTGHLNAFRAYQQFNPGQWKPDAPVPIVGWDYNTVNAVLDTSENTQNSTLKTGDSFRDYRLKEPLKQGSFVAITLAWNRRVELEDTNKNDQYDEGEEFRDRGLNNLDLYLMPEGENDIAKSIRASISSADSVEHIFYPIPQAGRYKIRVQFRQQVNEATQPYALAWWTVPAP